MEGVKNDLENFKDSFLESQPMDKEVEYNWNALKDAILKAMEKNIPKKQLSSWQDVPWMNHLIKRMIHKKKRLWNKAKRTKTDKDWKSFRDIRKDIRQK
jgi:hypothetical protein